MAHLSVAGNPEGQDRFDLEEVETTLGRHPDCHIVVEAGAVSRFHAKIVRQDEECVLEDSGSRNGTFLNGRMISSPSPLSTGDVIRISDVEFIFTGRAENTAEPPTQTPLPAFMGGQEMTFDGSNFGIQMVDEEATGSVTSKIHVEQSDSGLKVSATPEAKLEALMQINRRLTGALAVDEVLPKVLESLFTIFPAADRGFVVTVEQDESLVPRWVKTRNPHDDSETVRISRTIVRKVIESGQPILSLDASSDAQFDSSQSIADFSIRSMICAPLLDADGNAFGALQIDSLSGRGQFREEDSDLLAGVAAQAGIVIQNARMHEQALHQKEVEQDLKLATDVQQAFLPSQPPDSPGFKVTSYYKAANHIGGDYYDYIHLDQGRVAIVVADVVGHGVAAAMFMAKLSAETRFCLARTADLAKATEQLNDRMSLLQVERFITFLVVVIDSNQSEIAICNAGHMPPMIRQAGDGSLHEPGEEESGLPIAIMDGVEYETTIFPLEIGDVAVLYTDGINEAMDADDEEFGTDALRDLVRSGGDAESVRDRIVTSVLDHQGARAPFDDMCVVVIERVQATDDDVDPETLASRPAEPAVPPTL
ncbi:MAG: SpoIIE family protein phosphatase [Planctomycetota bacterium]